MNIKEATASCSAKTLAANKENLHMNISTINQSLKSALVFAALEGKISYQTAYEVINKQCFRGI
jgi:adenylosuccinate lyase